MRFENECACGRRKVAGAIACSACYDEARQRREQRDYFVSIIRSTKQRGLLAGPFAAHDEALAHVDAARKLACELDQWAWFYSFGTCSLPTGSGRRGVLNERMGL